MIINTNAHLVLCSILGLSLREWSDTAVHSDLALHVFEFIQESLSLYLFLFEFFSYTVKLGGLSFIGFLQLLLLYLSILQFFSSLSSSASLLYKLFHFLEKFLLLLLLIGELNLKVVDLSETILHIFTTEGQVFLQLCNLVLLLFDSEVSLTSDTGFFGRD